MKRSFRKGVGLIQIIALMPLILAVMVVAQQVNWGLLKAQAVENGLMSDQAVARDMVRRFRSDVREADTAVLRRGESIPTLELGGGESTVIYRCEGGRVERIEQVGDLVLTRYDWHLDHSTADLQHEVIGSSAGVVWLMLSSVMPMGQGPDLDGRLAVATAVGGGGAP